MPQDNAQPRACLVVHGPDADGLVAQITALVGTHGGSIVVLDQFTDPDRQQFFLRVEFTLKNFGQTQAALEKDFAAVLSPKSLTWQLTNMSQRKRMIVLASKSDHCLVELLWRHSRGELNVDIPMVISNHRDVEQAVKNFGIPFVHVPSAGPDKSAAEAEILRLTNNQADFLVLARYMQIISNEFLDKVGMPIINIHHSFLPAFIGASPYRKAKERGVKMIGATAHYVTAELDEGPIIEQDIARVTHVHSAAGMQERGQYVERAVLSRAVQWHAEDRVVRQGNHTIIFA
ncbi:formyltetrahydrofolate deformylase [Neomicrococcus lactis]